MRCTRLPVLLSIALLSLLHANTPALAQDTDNEAIAAAKKAAVIVEGRGTAPIKPTTFYFKVEIVTDKVGLSATQAEYEKSIKTLHDAVEKAGFRSSDPQITQILLRTGESTFQGLSGPESQYPPNSTYRVMGGFNFAVSTSEKAREAFAVMRATGVAGNVTLFSGISDDVAARLAALKAAIVQAKQRVQVLGEAAKPKEFDLVFVKEGDYEIPASSTYASLTGKEPLSIPQTVGASANVTLFYGFKPVPANAASKAVVKNAPQAVAKKTYRKP